MKKWTKLFLNGKWHIASCRGRLEVAVVTAYKNRAESDANAKLIESAPELLEALKAILTSYEHYVAPLNLNARAADFARAAITKAEGPWSELSESEKGTAIHNHIFKKDAK